MDIRARFLRYRVDPVQPAEAPSPMGLWAAIRRTESREKEREARTNDCRCMHLLALSTFGGPAVLGFHP